MNAPGEDRVAQIRRLREGHKSHGYTSSREALESWVDDLLTRLREVEEERDRWQEKYETEYDITARVWRALGIVTYEDARGNSIDWIVKDQRTRLAQAEQRVVDLQQQIDFLHDQMQAREQRVEGLEAALTRLASNEAFGRPFALGHDVVSRELGARLDYARAALTPPPPAPRDP